MLEDCGIKDHNTGVRFFMSDDDDQKYYPGAVIISGGLEYVIVSKPQRGYDSSHNGDKTFLSFDAKPL
jgi:hypothetical protein